jgi:hypothetical protein
MPLSLSEKKFLISLFEENWSTFIASIEIKSILLKSYMLLQNQKNPAIRESIALHSANQIVARSQGYPGLRDFFRESILATKTDSKFLQKIFLHSSLATNLATFYYERFYETKGHTELVEIFKNDKEALKQATKTFQDTSMSLKKWIKDQPRKYFNEEAEINSRKFFSKGNIVIDVFLIAVFLITFALAHTEENNNMFSALMLAMLMTYFALPAIEYLVRGFPAVSGQINYYKLLNKHVQFSINTLEAYENANNMVVLATPVRRAPVIYQPYIAIDICKEPESAYLEEAIIPLAAKVKIKTRGHATIADTIPVAATVTQSLYTAEFFNDKFADANAYYIVPLNCKRKTAYFAIWDANNISSNVNNEADQQSYAELLEVFKKGTLAGKTGQSGIKYLCNLGIFELKKKSIAARVIGNEEIVKEGRKALIFSEFSRRGLH